MMAVNRENNPNRLGNIRDPISMQIVDQFQVFQQFCQATVIWLADFLGSVAVGNRENVLTFNKYILMQLTRLSLINGSDQMLVNVNPLLFNHLRSVKKLHIATGYSVTSAG